MRHYVFANWGGKRRECPFPGSQALNEIGDKALAENGCSGDCHADRVEDNMEEVWNRGRRIGRCGG